MRGFKILMTIFLATGIWSCSLQKDLQKQKTDTDVSLAGERSYKRAGDTVIYRTQLHLKDTTVYTVNRQGTTLKTVYGSVPGQVVQSDCMSSMVEVFEKWANTIKQSELQKTKTESAALSDRWILYLVLGFVVIVCFGFFLMFRVVNKQGAALAAIVDVVKK